MPRPRTKRAGHSRARQGAARVHPCGEDWQFSAFGWVTPPRTDLLRPMFFCAIIYCNYIRWGLKEVFFYRLCCWFYCVRGGPDRPLKGTGDPVSCPIFWPVGSSPAGVWRRVRSSVASVGLSGLWRTASQRDEGTWFELGGSRLVSSRTP